MAAVELSIRNLVGNIVCNVSAQLSWSILDVKDAIHADVRIRRDEQKLLLPDALSVLSNASRLDEVLPQGSEVELILIHVNKWIQEVEEHWKRLRKAPPEIRNDPEIVLAAVLKSDGEAFKFAGDDARMNPKIIQVAVQKNIQNLQYVTGDMDHDFLLEFVYSNPACLNYCLPGSIHRKLAEDRGFMLLALRHPSISDYKVLRLAELHNRAVLEDRGFMLEALGRAVEAWSCTAETLRKDDQFLIAALQVQPTLLHSLPLDRCLQRDVMLAALQGLPGALREVLLRIGYRRQNKKLQKGGKNAESCAYSWADHQNAPIWNQFRNMDVLVQDVKGRELDIHEQPSISKKQFPLTVTTLVTSHSIPFHFSAEALLRDREVVMCACHERRPVVSEHIFQWAVAFHSDREVVLAAVSTCGQALQFAAQELREDHQIVQAAVAECPMALEFARGQACADRQLVLNAIALEPHVFKFAAEELRRDVDVALVAVRASGMMLEFTAGNLCNCHVVVLSAVQEDFRAIRFACAEMGVASDIALAVLRSTSFKNWYENATNQDKRIITQELVLSALQEDGLALQFVPFGMRANRELVLTAVKQNGLALEFAMVPSAKPRCRQSIPNSLQDDAEIVLAAVQQNGCALKFASEDLQANLSIASAAVRENPDAVEFVAKGVRCLLTE